MKPFKIFIFFTCIVLSILTISLFFPEKGITVYPGFTIRFASPVDFINLSKPDYKDINTILAETKILSADSAEAIIQISNLIIDSVHQKNVDSIIFKNDTFLSKNINYQQFKKDSIQLKKSSKKIHRIEYPNNNSTLLFPFFNALINLQQNKTIIRILHFGDSQIEGDRITSFIRNELQKQFGGTGNGLVPIQNFKFNNVSVQLLLSDNWTNYTLRNHQSIPENFKHFGVLLNFSRFSDFIFDNKITGTQTATITFKRQSFAYPLSREYKTLTLFYGFNRKPFAIQLIKDDIADENIICPPSHEVQEIKWQFEQTPKQFTLKFQGEDSPSVLGLALDGKTGIAVDNIPIRGSSGLEFTKTNPDILISMFKKLNIKLILIQVGVNVVPNIVENYLFYELALYKQLMYLKHLQPDVPIILLGVSDAARKQGTWYESYPNIEKICKAQRNAAFKANCAYWSTYKAMGGKNSMPGWVFAKPPLAQKDFIHFSYRGSKLIGEMFLNALLADFNDYIYQQKNNENDTTLNGNN